MISMAFPTFPNMTPPNPIDPNELPTLLPAVPKVFFAVRIAKPTLSSLMVPPKFVEAYMNHVPMVVTLRNTVDMRHWVIVIDNVDDGVHFGHGWGVFRDAYGIKKDYILTFAYDGDTHYDVTVINSDGLVSLTVAPELLVSVDPGSVVATTSVISHVQLSDGESDGDSDFGDRDTISFVGLKPVRTCARCGNVRDEPALRSLKKKRKRTGLLGGFVARQRLNCTPHYLAKVGPAAISDPFKLILNKDFAEKCLPIGKSYRTLRVKGKASYVVQVKRKAKEALICYGFSTFVKECGLELGDMLMIEESKLDKRIWNITVGKMAKADEAPIVIA